MPPQVTYVMCLAAPLLGIVPESLWI
jgi:hypothetical protein